MASAEFEIDPGTGTFGTPGAFQPAAAGATIICRIADVTGIKSATWRIFGTHSSAVTAPTITLGGTPYGQTATFTLPSGFGQAYGIEVTAIANDNTQLPLVKSKVLVAFAHGDVRAYPIFVGETTEQDETHGYVMQINYLLELLGGGVTGADGPPGGETFPWTYATSTVDADPGNGLLRMNGADFASTDELYVDLVNANNVTMTDWLDSIDGGTMILFRGDARETNFAIYRIESVATATGYRKINLRSLIMSVGSLDTTAANTYVALDRSGGGGSSVDIFPVTATVTLGTAAANTVTYEAVTVPGVVDGDVVIALDAGALDAPTNFLQPVVTADDEITIPMCNPSGSGDAVGSLTLGFLIYRPGSSLPRYTATVSFGTVATISTSYISATVPGVRYGDYVVATVHDIDAPSGTGMCRVTADDTVEIPIVNPSGSGDAVGDKSVTFTIVRPNIASGFLVVTQAHTIASVGADTAAFQSATITGAKDGDYVCNITNDISATALITGAARVTADDTIALSYANPTAGGIAPGSTSITALLWRPANASGQGPAGPAGTTGAAGSAGADGADGRAGGESFYYTFKTDTTDSDPSTTYLKLNHAYANSASMLYIDPQSYDVNGLQEWIEQWPTGGSIVLYQKDDPTTFIIYEIGTITPASFDAYYRVELTGVLGGKSGNWTFDTVAGNVVISLSRAGVGTGSLTTTLAGAGSSCLFNVWRRVHHDDVDGRSAQLPVYIPRLNQWVQIGFEDDLFIGSDPNSGLSYGRLVLWSAKNEGGSTGLVEFSRRVPDATEGWTEQETIDAVGTAKGPLTAAVGQYPAVGTATATRLFVGFSRTSGGTASNKLAYSDDFGETFTFVTLNRSDDYGPREVFFTGLNWLACYDAPTVPYSEYSTDDGVTWQQATKDSSDSRRFFATDGNGLVVCAGITDSVDVSDDHGVTWTENSFPTRNSGEYVTGVAWLPVQQKFVAITTDARYSHSDDGTVWSDWADFEFELNRYVGNAKPLWDRGLVVCGSILALPMYDGAIGYNEAYASDVFYSTDGGITWKHSGAFSGDIMLDPTLTQRQRVQLRSSTPTVVSGADRAQLFMMGPYGSPGTGTDGGQWAAGWLSASDTLTAVATASTSTTTTAAVGSAFVRLNFDTSTTIGDPSNGYFRLNNSDPTAATQLAMDDRNVDDQDITTAIQAPGRKVIHIYDASTGDTVYQLHAKRHVDEAGYTRFYLDETLATFNGSTLANDQEYSFSIDVVSPRFPWESEWAAPETYGSVVAATWTTYIPCDEFLGLGDGVYPGRFIMVSGGNCNGYRIFDIPASFAYDSVTANGFYANISISDLSVIDDSVTDGAFAVSTVDISGEKFIRLDFSTTDANYNSNILLKAAQFRLESAVGFLPGY